MEGDPWEEDQWADEKDTNTVDRHSALGDEAQEPSPKAALPILVGTIALFALFAVYAISKHNIFGDIMAVGFALVACYIIFGVVRTSVRRRRKGSQQ
jgi:hypothetical protein